MLWWNFLNILSLMSNKLPYKDGEPFIAKLEEAVEAADADLIEANLPKLREIVRRFQDRSYELAKLRTVVHRHNEPFSSERKPLA